MATNQIKSDLIWESDSILLRHTAEADLAFVADAESDAENWPYIRKLPRETHLEIMASTNSLHMIVESKQTGTPCGFIILTDTKNPNRNLLLQTLVITEKGRGYGRDALRLLKKVAFDKLGAHRLQLMVKLFNEKARALYKSEGFVEEGVMREAAFQKETGVYQSVVLMSILEQEHKG